MSVVCAHNPSTRHRRTDWGLLQRALILFPRHDTALDVKLIQKGVGARNFLKFVVHVFHEDALLRTRMAEECAKAVVRLRGHRHNAQIETELLYKLVDIRL